MICKDCGEDKPDVMRRSDVPAIDGDNIPALCTACCAKRPGRQWMKASAQ